MWVNEGSLDCLGQILTFKMEPANEIRDYQNSWNRLFFPSTLQLFATVHHLFDEFLVSEVVNICKLSVHTNEREGGQAAAAFVDSSEDLRRSSWRNSRKCDVTSLLVSCFLLLPLSAPVPTIPWNTQDIQSIWFDFLRHMIGQPWMETQTKLTRTTVKLLILLRHDYDYIC